MLGGPLCWSEAEANDDRLHHLSFTTFKLKPSCGQCLQVLISESRVVKLSKPQEQISITRPHTYLRRNQSMVLLSALPRIPPQCRQKKNIIKETNQKQLEVLREMSSWCLQDLGSSSNRTKVCSRLSETKIDGIVHIEDSRWSPTSSYLPGGHSESGRPRSKAWHSPEPTTIFLGLAPKSLSHALYFLERIVKSHRQNAASHSCTNVVSPYLVGCTWT